jgi:N-methylhydantoinase B
LHPQPASAGVELAPGQTIVSVSSGGGGYGPPWQRDPERVAHDVREGWVSRERAREVYGVEVDERGEVVVEATRERRVETSTSG